MSYLRLILSKSNAGLSLFKRKPIQSPDRNLITSVSHQFKQRLPFEPDANVSRDVLVYSHTRETFYKLLSYFGVSQFVFWSYLGVFAYTDLRDVPVEEENEKLGIDPEKRPWWTKINLGDNKYRNGLTIICFAFGYFMLAFTMIYPLRAVHKIWLLKGGQTVHVSTFAPFGQKRTIKTSVNNISCIQSRTQAANHIPMKVKGRWFYFLLDKKGTFHNTELFDYYIGLMRNLK